MNSIVRVENRHTLYSSVYAAYAVNFTFSTGHWTSRPRVTAHFTSRGRYSTKQVTCNPLPMDSVNWSVRREKLQSRN